MKILPQNNIDYSRFLYPLLLYLIFLICYIFIFDTKLDLGGDNAIYFTLGKALAQGEGYVHLRIPGMPAASHYPPGYPLIVGGALTLWPGSFLAVKITNGVFLFLSSLVAFYLLKKLTSNALLAFAASVFILINPVLLRSSTIMMSESSFLFFCILTLYLLIRSEEIKEPLKNWYFYLFIFSLVAGFYIKTLGIALFGGVILFLLVKKKWGRAGITGVLYILFTLPWIIRNRQLGRSGYLDSIVQVNPYRLELGTVGPGDLLQRFLINLQRYIAVEIPSLTLPFVKPDYTSSAGIVEWVIGLAVVGMISYGIYMFKNYRLLFLCCLLTFFGILLLWPEIWVGTRFMLGIAPILLFTFFTGCYEAVRKGVGKIEFNLKPDYLPLYLLVLPLLFIPELYNQHQRAKADYPTNWKAYFSIAIWVNENLPEEAVISCRKPGLFYVVADRFTVRYDYTPDKEQLIEGLRKNGVDYVVMDQLGYSSTARYLIPAVEEYRSLFEVVLHDKTTNSYLLRLKEEP